MEQFFKRKSIANASYDLYGVGQKLNFVLLVFFNESCVFSNSA
jgi:hypothetical protein